MMIKLGQLIKKSNDLKIKSMKENWYKILGKIMAHLAYWSLKNLLLLFYAFLGNTLSEIKLTNLSAQSSGGTAEIPSPQKVLLKQYSMTFLELKSNKKLLVFSQDIDDTENVLFTVFFLSINGGFSHLQILGRSQDLLSYLTAVAFYHSDKQRIVDDLVLSEKLSVFLDDFKELLPLGLID